MANSKRVQSCLGAYEQDICDLLLHRPPRKTPIKPIRYIKRSLIERFVYWACLPKTFLSDIKHLYPETKADWNQQFRGLSSMRIEPRHPHPTAAMERSAAVKCIHTWVHRMGYKVYAISPSAREMHSADASCRQYFWAKDLLLPERIDGLSEDHVITMIDVDYYVDMNAVLELARPVILYTFIPENAAGQHDEFAYRFDGDKLHYVVSGGLNINHELWDYDRDSVLVEDRRRHVFIYYELLSYRVSPCHYIIAFIPGWIARSITAHRANLTPMPLMRLKPNQHRVTMVPSRTDRGKMSLAFQGYMLYQTVEMYLEGVIMAAQRLTVTKLPKVSQVADMARFLEREHIVPLEKASLAASLLVARYGKSQPEDDSLADQYDFGDGYPVGQKLHPALVEYPAVIPTRCPEAEMVTIAERVELPPALKAAPGVAARYLDYAEELIRFLVPCAHKGCPLELEEVVEAQEKPRQKERNRETLPFLPSLRMPTFSVKAFQKAETYNSPKAPRNISTVPPAHNLILSSFTRAMKLDLKHNKPFGPGKTPDEITEIVCSLSGPLLARDFSTFDGTVNGFLNNVVLEMCQYWCAPRYWSSFRHALMTEHKAKGKTATGIKYHIGQTRVTGSPVTADHNTLINMFVSYTVWREMGRSPRHAYDSLGLYYGDDSIEKSPDLSVHQCVIENLGLIAKPEIIPLGDPVPFLGRFFRTGASIADPLRTLGKLHISVSPLPKLQAAANKACGYAVSDAMTPIIGVWARTILAYAEKEGVAPDLTEMTTDEWHRYHQGPWPQNRTVLDLFLDVTGYDRNVVMESEAMVARRQFELALPNPSYKERLDISVNKRLPQVVNLDPYAINSCLYEAVAPFVNYPSGALLRYRTQLNGHLVPPLKMPAEEPHVKSLAEFLAIELDVYVPAIDKHFTYHYGEHRVEICLDLMGEHYYSFAKVEEQRERVFRANGATTEHFIQQKIPLFLEDIDDFDRVVELGIAPGHLWKSWTNPGRLIGFHYVGEGHLRLMSGVRRKGATIRPFNNLSDHAIPDAEIWVSDMAPAGISDSPNQSFMLRPLITILVDKWLKSRTPRLRFKWFFDGPPPHVEYLVMARRGPNPNGIEVILTYMRDPPSCLHEQAEVDLALMISEYLGRAIPTKDMNNGQENQNGNDCYDEEAEAKTTSSGATAVTSHDESCHNGGAISTSCEEAASSCPDHDETERHDNQQLCPGPSSDPNPLLRNISRGVQCGRSKPQRFARGKRHLAVRNTRLVRRVSVPRTATRVGSISRNDHQRDDPDVLRSGSNPVSPRKLRRGLRQCKPGYITNSLKGDDQSARKQAQSDPVVLQSHNINNRIRRRTNRDVVRRVNTERKRGNNSGVNMAALQGSSQEPKQSGQQCKSTVVRRSSPRSSGGCRQAPQSPVTGRRTKQSSVKRAKHQRPAHLGDQHRAESTTGPKRDPVISCERTETRSQRTKPNRRRPKPTSVVGGGAIIRG